MEREGRERKKRSERKKDREMREREKREERETNKSILSYSSSFFKQEIFPFLPLFFPSSNGGGLVTNGGVQW